jgi:acetylornithine/succinyldiaminopimelate/putrescine aminotransferase
MKHKNFPIINSDDETYAQEKLKGYYENEMIPPEKKNYLTNLKESEGPYLAVENASDEKTHFLMDAASQIATLGLGFNPPVFYGAAHHLDAWLNLEEGQFENLRKAYDSFFKRKLGWQNVFTTFCHSGAEANETALGYCYQNRKKKSANRVLAFEGSFHGRMMVTLSATWNPAKREPFEWEDFKAVYSPFPDSPDGQSFKTFPEGWRLLWDQSPLKTWSIPSGLDNNDPLLQKEIQCLGQVRDRLNEGKIFSIIVEPMQCEGGDRFGTDRFFTALLLMARSYQVPIIFDEVQTGYHLGQEFFWHSYLNLKDEEGNILAPSYVTMAKKAQIGLVVSHDNHKFKEEFSTLSAYRGYLHALSLDQSSKKIHELEQMSMRHLNQFIDQFSDYLENPRGLGMSFAFDFKEKEKVPEFIKLRFKHGLLYYPAGEKTLRFRLNLSFTEEDISFLFEGLASIGLQVFENKITPLPTITQSRHRNVSKIFKWQNLLLTQRLALLQKGQEKTEENLLQQIEDIMELPEGSKLTLINGDNFSSFKDRIKNLQEEVYEPSRQTSIETFELTAKADKGVSLAIENEEKLLGICFASPLKNYPLERGLRRDPSFSDENCLYMVDTTISPSLKGEGFGRDLKYALTLLAQTNGVKEISGRNRDHMAASMLNINLSLGGIEKFYIEEDYPDFEEFRDVIYYSSPTKWTLPQNNLSSGISSPLGANDLNAAFMEEQLPCAINKVCLSNFVSERFLSHVKDIFEQLPSSLRHGYTASGQSECVDKLVKILWHKIKEKRTVHKMMTFEGHFFGTGSFLSRSLSMPDEAYFPVSVLPHPEKHLEEEVLEKVELELENGDYLAVWIEPLLQKTMTKTSLEFLTSLKKLCQKYDVPLVYNETASQMYRYGEESFFLSEIETVRPDAGFSYFGGQAAFAFCSDEYFLEKPLMMISTWDGDEFSLANYHLAMKNILNNKEEFLKTKKNFQEKLMGLLEKYSTHHFQLHNGVGNFQGKIPHELSKYLNFKDEKFLVCPSWNAMKTFLSSK